MTSEISLDLKKKVQTLVPFFETQLRNNNECIEADPLNHLDSFYLFSVSGFSSSVDEHDICQYIENRFQSALSAAHRANWSTLTAIFGSREGVKIFLGFKDSNSTHVKPQVFEQILRGLLPGLDLSFKEATTIGKLLGNNYFGGIVAGVPILKIENERQRFSLPSLIRSLNGEVYTLQIVSTPVPNQTLVEQLQHIWELHDQFHQFAKLSIAKGKGGGFSIQESEAISELTGNSKTGGVFIGIIENYLAVNASISSQKSRSTSTSKSTTKSSHWTDTISQEQQNSVAKQLENITGKYAERMLKSINIGEWETTITFATQTEASRKILTGSLLGELAKPSTDIYPPSVYYEEINNIRPLLLPSIDNLSEIFPRSLASYLTSEELSAISCPPVENLPGYEVRHTPSLSLSASNSQYSNSSHIIGNVCEHSIPIEGVSVKVEASDLAKHLFVCGLTGSGKTTTLKEIILRCEKPFLILESAKRDYRQLIGHDKFRDKLNVYTIGNSMISPLSMNPFYVMPKISPIVHIDFLKAIFNASFSLYGPMPHILEKCIHNIYLKKGWNLTKGYHPYLYNSDGEPDFSKYDSSEAKQLFPTISDLKHEIQDYIKYTLDYKGEVSDNIRTAILTRLESLCIGSKGLLFGTSHTLDIEKLLQHPTVLELEDLSDDDDKAFFVGLILTFISEYRQSNHNALDPLSPKQDGLQHLLVIEEAHRLLKNVSQENHSEHIGNPRGKAVEFFANTISEMRSTGQGVVVVEQIPSKILPDVIKNTNTKIVHRLVALDDQTLISSSLGLKPDETICLTSLKTGHMLYHKEGMQRPVEVKVNSPVESKRISHQNIKRKMQSTYFESLYIAARTEEICNLLSESEESIPLNFICSVCTWGNKIYRNLVNDALLLIENEIKKKKQFFSREEVTSYLNNQLLSELMSGPLKIYENQFKGLSEIVESVVLCKNNSIENFLLKLQKGWRVNDAKEGVIKHVVNIVLEKTERHDVQFKDRSRIEEICRSHFFFNDQDLQKVIVDSVINKMRGI